MFSSAGTNKKQTAPRPRRLLRLKPEVLSRVDWQLAGSIALLATAFLLILGTIVYPRVWILSGVRSLGVDLGGLTRVQATSALRESWQTRAILLNDGVSTWTYHPAELGLTLDVETTVQAAFEQGRFLGALDARLRGEQSADWVKDIHPVLALDLAAAKSTLQALRPEIDVAPVNTSLRRVDGWVEASEPRPGRSLGLVETLDVLQRDPLAVAQSGRLPLAVHPVPPLAFDVSDLVTQANEWLARTVSIVAYDPISDETLTWTLGREEWGAWVSLEVDRFDPTQIGWAFDDRAAAMALDAWEASLGAGRTLDREAAPVAIKRAIMDDDVDPSPPARLRVHHSPRQYTVRSGETLSSIADQVGIPYPWIEQANPGVSDALQVGQVLTIPSPDVLLPLPVVENKRIVVSLSRQRMWAYENGALLWEWPVSTGIPSSPTAPGVFQIQSHDPNAYASSWDLWMPYFMGIYRPVPTSSFMNGFHGFPTRDGANLLWTGDLGHPVTFGCILLGNEGAPLLYQWAEEGVVVEILE